MTTQQSFIAKSVSGSFERLYRISVRGSDLYFIQLPGISETAQALTVHFGLIGLLIGQSMKKRAQQKAEAMLRSAEQQDPELALRENKNNFKLYAPEIQQAVIEPPAFLQLHGKHAGRLTINLRDGKKKKFEFESPEEMKTAMDVLSRLLNLTLTIGAEWDESKKRFQKPKRRG